MISKWKNENLGKVDTETILILSFFRCIQFRADFSNIYIKIRRYRNRFLKLEVFFYQIPYISGRYRNIYFFKLILNFALKIPKKSILYNYSLLIFAEIFQKCFFLEYLSCIEKFVWVAPRKTWKIKKFTFALIWTLPTHLCFFRELQAILENFANDILLITYTTNSRASFS